VDTDLWADEAWILGVQRKLYQWSQAHPNDVWRDLWGWLTDPRILRHAWRRVASNRGARSAGVDGVTAESIRKKDGEQRFLDRLRSELRSGAYLPSPSRRKLIPKAGKPGQFWPLGIPTVSVRKNCCYASTPAFRNRPTNLVTRWSATRARSLFMR
jgi:RNA-directed DNA polymerase